MASKFVQIMQLYHPSLHLTLKQQTFWIRRSASCRFSISSGAVRYIPKVRKQNPARWPGRHTNPRLNLSTNEGTSEHVHKVPSEAQEGFADFKQNAEETHARSGSGSNEENDLCIASTQLSCESSRQRKIRSSEFLEAQLSTQHMPASSQHCLSGGGSLDSSDYFPENKEKGEPISEEERGIEKSYTQNVAGCKAKDARQLQIRSPYPALPTLPTNIIQGANGHVDSFEDMGHRREREILSVKAERKGFLQAPKESPPFSAQEIRAKKVEAGIKGRSSLPWQDAESFLLKIQREKQRSLELCGMLHTAAIENSSIDDEVDEDGFSLFEEDVLEQSEDVQEAHRLRGLHSLAEQEHAKNQAVWYLSRRPYTAAQLKKKLVDKKVPPELADYAVSSVQNCGLQSDLAYAETFSTARFKHGGWGPRRIKLGLKQRGIGDEIIEAAIDRVFCEEEEVREMEQDGVAARRASELKMSKAAMDQLLVQATKQWKRGQDTSIDTKTRRMVCWLQYRGFNYSVVKHVLKHLQKETLMEDEH